MRRATRVLGQRLAAVLARPAVQLLAVAALTTALGMYRLGAASFWFDEAFSVQAAERGWRYVIGLASGPEINMFLYYALLRVWVLLGSSETWVRLPSVLATVAAVCVTWVLVRRLLGSRTASVAALLLAVNAFAVRYAQEARSYALLLLLVVLATYALVRSLDGGGRRWWVSYAVLASLIVYAQIMGALILVAHALAVMASPVRPRARTMATIAGAVTLLAAPLGFVLIRSLGSGVNWISPLTVASAGNAGIALSGGATGPPDPWAYALVLLYGVLIAGGAISLYRTRSGSDRWIGALLLSWLVVPVALAILASIVKPLFVTRYLIAVVPAAAILAAVGITRIRPRAAAITLLAIVVALAGWGDASYYRNPGKADWRGVTAYVAQEARPGDRWVAYETWTWIPMSLYAARIAPTGFPQRLWRGLNSSSPDFSDALASTAATTAREGRTIWVVATGSSRGRTDPVTGAAFTGLRRYYRVAERREFDQVSVVKFVPNGT